MSENNKILSDACVLAEELYWGDFFKSIDETNAIQVSDKQRNAIYNLIGDNVKHLGSISSFTPTIVKPKKKFRAILIAAILIILLAAAAFAVTPIRSFIIKIYDDCAEIIFHTDDTDDYFYSEFTYIPDGYKLSTCNRSKNSQYLLYLNGENRVIINTLKNGKSKTVIDTENSTTGQININEFTGYYSLTDSSIILIWSTGKYNHCIIADTAGNNITLENVVKIAQSKKPLS